MCCCFVLEALLSGHRSAKTHTKLPVFANTPMSTREGESFKLRLLYRSVTDGFTSRCSDLWCSSNTCFSNLPHSPTIEERLPCAPYNIVFKCGNWRFKCFSLQKIRKCSSRVVTVHNNSLSWRLRHLPKRLTTGFLPITSA